MDNIIANASFCSLSNDVLLNTDGGGFAEVAAAIGLSSGVVIVVAVVAIVVVGVVGYCIYKGSKAGNNKADKEYYENINRKSMYISLINIY